MRLDARVETLDGPGFESPATNRRKELRVVRSREGELLVRHRTGDTSAFAELVEEYRAPIWAHLIRCGVAEADREDLFQEVFLRIHRAAASYQPERPAHPWIFTIVSNTVRSYLRKRRVRQLVFGDSPPDEPPDDRPGGERRSAARQKVALLERQIRQLPSAQRQVVLLACVEKLPLKEVAMALGTPVNTVKTRLRRARIALAAGLARIESGEVSR